MSDVGEILSDLERRVRALKSNRLVHIRQIALLEKAFSQSVTLATHAGAEFEISVVCAGPPFVDVAYAGFGASGSGIIPQNTVYNIDENTAIITCDFYNSSASTSTANLVLTAFALNGLSATMRRVF